MPFPIADVPEAPGTPEINNPQPTTLTLTWKPPVSDGGAEITNYVVERKDKFSSRWTPISIAQVIKTTRFEVTGLTEGTDYEFRVSAENKAGVGPPSNPTYLKVSVMLSLMRDYPVDLFGHILAAGETRLKLKYIKAECHHGRLSTCKSVKV